MPSPFRGSDGLLVATQLVQPVVHLVHVCGLDRISVCGVDVEFGVVVTVEEERDVLASLSLDGFE